MKRTGDAKDLASSLGAHFHVDAAWGFPLLLERSDRMRGVQKADTVAVDGHKLLLGAEILDQLWEIF